MIGAGLVATASSLLIETAHALQMLSDSEPSTGTQGTSSMPTVTDRVYMDIQVR